MKTFVVTKTPMRISFVGGGSDLKEFYKNNNGGAVISAAINKYMYIFIHKFILTISFYLTSNLKFRQTFF